MRLVRFGGAMSLDGYIAGPGGEYDWIVMDPDFDFSERMTQFDTFLIGRKTFEAMLRMAFVGGASSVRQAAGETEYRLREERE
jgi:dihydrofolate reductase